MTWQIHPGGVRALWAADVADDSIALAWLGQASFAVRAGPVRILFDPYLVESAARMMPPPVASDFFTDVDWVLGSHAHSDHMDVDSLPILARVAPRCRFVMPASERDAAIGKCGLPADRLVCVDAGDDVDLGRGARLLVTPAAHEDRRRNARGEHHFLGFALRAAAGCVWHSGDTVVFDELVTIARELRADVALLPVNGRDEARTRRGIIGNMDFAEARALCVAAGIPRMVPHHFGLFAGNTVPPDVLARHVAESHDVACTLPRVDEWYELSSR